MLHHRACRAAAPQHRRAHCTATPALPLRPAVAILDPAALLGITRPVICYSVTMEYVPAATVCFGGRTEARSELSMFVGPGLPLATPGSLVEEFGCARVGVESRSAGGGVEAMVRREVPHVWAGGVFNNNTEQPKIKIKITCKKRNNSVLYQESPVRFSIRNFVLIRAKGAVCCLRPANAQRRTA